MENYQDKFGARYIFLTKEELLNAYKASRRPKIIEALNTAANFEELKATINTIATTGAQDRDEHEVFIALFDIASYFDDGMKIAFPIKTGVELAHAVHTLEELNEIRESNSNTDVAIITGEGMRSFQLKRYRGEMTTDALFSFLSGKLRSYGYNLGKVNLWVILQPEPFGVSTIDFPDLHQRVMQLPLQDCGEILITYNDRNTQTVLQRIYPEPGGMRTPLGDSYTDL